MSGKSGEVHAASNGPAARRERPSGVWRLLVGVGVLVLGLYVTIEVATRLIHRSEGYVPGEADCDDCGITLVLDNIGWLTAAVGGYLVLSLLLWWLLRRRRRSHLA